MRKAAFGVGFLVAMALAGAARADDVGDRFGVSGFLGAAFPVAPDRVTSEANSAGLTLGGMISLQLSSLLGVGLSYENMNLGNGVRVAPINAMVLFRFLHDQRWTPTFELGGGSAKGPHSDRIENIGFKTALGFDYFLTPSVALGPRLTYHYLSHSGDAQTYVHIVGLQAVVSYFFGHPSGG